MSKILLEAARHPVVRQLAREPAVMVAEHVIRHLDGGGPGRGAHRRA